MNLLIILESFFSFFSQFYDFGQERNHLNHQYISNKGVLIVVLPPRFFSLISTYHTIESFKEKRTFLGGFSFVFFFAWKALEQPQKSLSLVLWSHHMKFRRNCHFCSVYKKMLFWIEPMAFCQYFIIILWLIIYKFTLVFIIFTWKSFWLDDRFLGMVHMFLRSAFQ